MKRIAGLKRDVVAPADVSRRTGHVDIDPPGGIEAAEKPPAIRVGAGEEGPTRLIKLLIRSSLFVSAYGPGKATSPVRAHCATTTNTVAIDPRSAQ